MNNQNIIMQQQKPSNWGAKWTDEEKELLLKYLKKSYDIETIAEKLNRSEGGVEAEIKKIIYEKHKDNMSAEDISNELNLTFKSVKHIIKVQTEKNLDKEINILEKENKLLQLQIENIRLKKELECV